MNQVTIGLLCFVDVPGSSFQDVVKVIGSRGSLVLVSRFRFARFLPVPLFVDNPNEMVQVRSEELLPVNLLQSLTITQRLIMTNRELSADESAHGIRQPAYLCCRYSARLSHDNRSGLIRRLNSEDIPACSQASFRVRHLRLPEASLLGAWMQRPVIEGRQYTFGDAFCGAGGAARGAHLAGFEITWGFDCDSTAGSSFRANFAKGNQNIVFYHMDAQAFPTVPVSEVYVDLLHLSPSCQAFSAANTVVGGGQNGDYNRDSFLSCLAIIKHVRPRLISMEQVPGLLYNRSHNYFDTFLRDIIGLGFSVTWKVLNSEQFGVPQARKRLILIASCPGHRIPVFPDPGITISKVNDFLRPGARKPAFDGLWAGTVMTAGARTIDGAVLSIEELAAIQSFPRDHVFMGSLSAMRKQIGNAVPPQLARHIFAAMLDCLQRQDRSHSSAPIVID